MKFLAIYLATVALMLIVQPLGKIPMTGHLCNSFIATCVLWAFFDTE
jgi:energy-converting hydrogenase Eha subunit C